VVNTHERELRSGQPVHRYRGAALTVILVGMFLDLMDGGVVNVALPPIQRDLHADSASLQWLVAGYMLPFALLLITGGRLGDIYGRKRIFMTGMAFFAITSALCSIAQNTPELITGRVLQGLAAALMVPQVMATIQVMYAPKERSGPITAAGSIYAISAVGGPIVGALLISGDLAGLGWRLIFLVNIPVAVAALAATAFVMPESKSDTATRIDIGGMLLAALGLLLLLYPLVVGHEDGWPAWTFASMAAGVVVLALFVLHQRGRQDRSPLLPLSLFRHRSFTGGLVILLLAMGSIFGMFLALSVFLQTGLGYTVLQSGLTGIAWGIASATFAGVALNVLGPRLGRLIVQIGLVLTALGVLGIMWTVLSLGPQLTTTSLILPMVIGGGGMGFAVSLVFDFALADVPLSDAGAASGVLNAFQQTGAAIGVSTVGALYFALTPADPTSPTWAAGSSEAFAHALWLPLAMAAVSFAASFLLPRKATHHDVI
jgi:EmrB/QacA subfamily drug resistance transporter